MGRDLEKEKLKAFSYYRNEYEPHWRIIDIFHDWCDGKLGPELALLQLYTAIDGRPTIKVLDTAGYWFRRAVKTEPTFESYVSWLASHKKALVRAASLQEMNEPRSPRDLALFEKLLADRSKEVRRSLIAAVEYGRWLGVLDKLAAIPPDTGLTEVCDFVRAGFVRRRGYLRFYSGKSPGGAGAIRSAPESHYAHVPFERISRDELTYRIKCGVWPTRPEDDFNLEAFARWRP